MDNCDVDPLGLLLLDIDAAASGAVLLLAHTLRGGRGRVAVTDPRSRDVVEDRLRRAGCRHHDGRWARFADLSAGYVELVTTDVLGITPEEVRRVVAGASPVPDLQRCMQPSLPDELLVHAVRFADAPRVPPPSERAAMNLALLATPSAWVDASVHADGWRAAAALRALRRAVEGGEPPDRRERTRIARERGRTDRLRPVGPWRRGPAVVAISGVDGAGKSTQVYALSAALTALGYAPAVEWSRITHTRGVPALERSVRRVLVAGHALLRADERAGDGRPDGAVAPAEPDRPTRRLRERHPVVNEGWATLVAAANAGAHRRAASAHRDRPDVIIRDRFVLDSAVHLRTYYGHGGPLATAETVLRLLSPRPAVAFHLQLPADVAYARKPEFPLSELERQVLAYAASCRGLGVISLDACRDRADLAAEIGWEVWRRLP